MTIATKDSKIKELEEKLGKADILNKEKDSIIQN